MTDFDGRNEKTDSIILQTNLRLTYGLLERIDAERGDVPRNTWIINAVEDALKPPQYVISVDGELDEEVIETIKQRFAQHYNVDLGSVLVMGKGISVSRL